MRKKERGLLKLWKKQVIEIVDITFDQVYHFAGNMLSVKNKKGDEFLVMSQSAYNVLTDDQKESIEHYCNMLPVQVDTIEKIGGGSARCYDF